MQTQLEVGSDAPVYPTQAAEVGRQILQRAYEVGVQVDEIQHLIDLGENNEMIGRLLEPLFQYLLRPVGGQTWTYCSSLKVDPRCTDPQRCFKESFELHFEPSRYFSNRVLNPRLLPVLRAEFGKEYLVTTCLDKLLDRSTAPGMESVEQFMFVNGLFFTPLEAHELFKRVSRNEMAMAPVICTDRRIRLVTRGSGHPYVRIEELERSKMKGRILYYRGLR